MKFEQTGLVLLAGALLGSNVVVVRLGIGEVPPMVLTTLRFLLTSAAFGVTIALMRRQLPSSRRFWIDILIAGITNTAIPVIVFTYALQYISSGVLGVLMALYPMLTAVLAHFYFEHERLNAVRLIGLALGLSGSLVLVLTDTTGLGEAGDLRGYVLAMIGVVAGAISVIFMRQRLADHDSIVVTAGQVLFSLPLVIPFALAGPAFHPEAVTWQGWFAIAYAALIGSFVGYVLLFVLVKRYGATSGALPGYVIPVVATVLGALLLQEVVSLPLIVGAGLVLTGVFLVST